LRPLNRVQQKAIFRTIMAEEYVLIRGMPGSGKTTAIVALIRLLVALGKTVLLTSYTHSAVDNVLIKLIHEDVDGATPFLRVGQVSRFHL
jgi:DNA replication ATP-dependent helicase Dna2